MKKIEPKVFIKAVEAYAEKLGCYTSAPNLSLNEKALAEATVYFLNQIIAEVDTRLFPSNKMRFTSNERVKIIDPSKPLKPTDEA